MKIRIRAYASLRAHLPGVRIGESTSLEVPDDSTVASALSLAGIPPAHAHLCLVNGRHRELDALLNDDDDLAVFPPVGGGAL